MRTLSHLVSSAALVTGSTLLLSMDAAEIRVNAHSMELLRLRHESQAVGGVAQPGGE